MWIKDIRNYEIEVHDGDNIIYRGNVDECPEDIRNKEAKDMKIGHKVIIITL